MKEGGLVGLEGREIPNGVRALVLFLAFVPLTDRFDRRSAEEGELSSEEDADGVFRMRASVPPDEVDGVAAIEAAVCRAVATEAFDAARSRNVCIVSLIILLRVAIFSNSSSQALTAVDDTPFKVVGVVTANKDRSIGNRGGTHGSVVGERLTGERAFDAFGRTLGELVDMSGRRFRVRDLEGLLQPFPISSLDFGFEGADWVAAGSDESAEVNAELEGET